MGITAPEYLGRLATGDVPVYSQYSPRPSPSQRRRKRKRKENDIQWCMWQIHASAVLTSGGCSPFEG